MRRRIGTQPALTGAAIGLAVCLTAPPIVIASSQTETFQLHLEVPNIAEAPNGDRVAVTGSGMFSIHPKTVTATGTFTHTDSAGNLVGSGSWTALELLTFQPYGCGVVTFPDPDVMLPPDFCGGRLMLRVLLSSTAGQFEGTLTVFCIIGPNPPNSHDEPPEEGVNLNVIGGINFNRIVSGMNVYTKTS